jgi:hypothetical protein
LIFLVFSENIANFAHKLLNITHERKNRLLFALQRLSGRRAYYCPTESKQDNTEYLSVDIRSIAEKGAFRLATVASRQPDE